MSVSIDQESYALEIAILLLYSAIKQALKLVEENSQDAKEIEDLIEYRHCLDRDWNELHAIH